MHSFKNSFKTIGRSGLTQKASGVFVISISANLNNDVAVISPFDSGFVHASGLSNLKFISRYYCDVMRQSFGGSGTGDTGILNYNILRGGASDPFFQDSAEYTEGCVFSTNAGVVSGATDAFAFGSDRLRIDVEKNHGSVATQCPDFEDTTEIRIIASFDYDSIEINSREGFHFFAY